MRDGYQGWSRRAENAWVRVFGQRPAVRIDSGMDKPPCSLHTIWNGDPVCTECGYVWKGDLSKYDDGVDAAAGIYGDGCPHILTVDMRLVSHESHSQIPFCDVCGADYATPCKRTGAEWSSYD